MKTTTKYTPETLPVSVSILSRWIDWSGWDDSKPDNASPVFRFMVELTYGDPQDANARRMRTEYSGGVLAFIPQAKRARWSKPGAHSSYLVGILAGKRYKYDQKETGHDSPAKALHFLISQAEISSASVCHSLVMDARSGEESFEDFCGNCGYDEDSRKAFGIYEACQKLGKEFRKLVGQDFEAIEEALQDY